MRTTTNSLAQVPISICETNHPAFPKQQQSAPKTQHEFECEIIRFSVRVNNQTTKKSTVKPAAKLHSSPLILAVNLRTPC